jgi:DNA polymerase III delta prime subunit
MENLAMRWRPKTLDDVVGQEEVVDSLKEKDELTHYLFIGPPGCGKTSIAHILSMKFDVPIHETNASDERGIGYVRDEIKRLTRIRGKRIILLDEVDNFTPEAFGALRRIMENPKSEAYFILTGNDGWKIIEPIKSRCSCYEFKRLDEEIILRRIITICKAEGIDIDEDAKEGLLELLNQANGDMRKALNLLEKVINKDKKITKKSVVSFKKPKISGEALVVALDGDFEKSKRLMEDAFITNRLSPSDIIKELYETIGELKIDNMIKIRLYKEIASTERACKTECDPILPLIQLIGFLATAWLLPHFEITCPMVKGGT